MNDVKARPMDPTDPSTTPQPQRRSGGLGTHLGIALLCLAVTTGCVKKAQTGADEPEKQSFTVTKKAYVHLGKAGQHIEKKKYVEALEEMERMKRRKYLSDHERALMWQMFAMIYALQEELEKSAESLASALELNALPEQTRRDMERNLAQAYLVVGEFAKSATVMTKWMGEEKEPTPEDHYILATAHAQSAAFAEALPWALKAVEGMKETREPWLQLLLSLRFELKQTAEVAELLKRMVELYPDNRIYWLQLAAALGDLGDSERSLAVMELIYTQGMLTEPKELLNLASMYLAAQVPIKTVRLVEKELAAGRVERNAESLQLLANALLLAHEERRALTLLQEAAALAPGPQLHVHIARVYVDGEKWSDARQALQEALKRAPDEAGAEAYLLLGMVEHSSARRGAAITAFRKAASYKATKRSASEWLGNLGVAVEGCEGSDCSADPQTAEAPGAPAVGSTPVVAGTQTGATQ